jgi:hypothetical protein
MQTIKTLISNKEVSSEKKEERKHWDKEEAVKNYADIQHKKLTVEESTPTIGATNWSSPYSPRRPSSPAGHHYRRRRRCGTRVGAGRTPSSRLLR